MIFPLPLMSWRSIRGWALSASWWNASLASSWTKRIAAHTCYQQCPKRAVSLGVIETEKEVRLARDTLESYNTSARSVLSRLDGVSICLRMVS